MKNRVKNVMFLGTGSDVGKSILAAAFCRILKNRGYAVAPFKAQNMSNNSFVTMEGGEIGRAQIVQAEAAGTLPSVHMNPVLLKPSSGLGAQIVLQGRVFGQMDAAEYHRYKRKLREKVLESYHFLADQYDVIVMEGAGSCCEMNLKRNDLVNFAMAGWVDAPCVLVADIDRGGVFAQIIGSMVLMTSSEKQRTLGTIINKFRGDAALFESGMDYIERKTRKPVFGLIPFYTDIHVDSEDSVAVQVDKRPPAMPSSGKLNVAVIRLPGISNFTDLEILEQEPDVEVHYLHHPRDLSGYDWLILPGTKNVVEDAVWLEREGFSEGIRGFRGEILGICGGYQLLGNEIFDPLGVESPRKQVRGLGLLPVETTLEGTKIVRRVVGTHRETGEPVQGYEIHMGRTRAQGTAVRSLLTLRSPGSSKDWEDGHVSQDGRIAGCYVHGLLDKPGLRTRLLNHLRERKGLKTRRSGKGRLSRFHHYDRLARHVERHCRVDEILKGMGLDS